MVSAAPRSHGRSAVVTALVLGCLLGVPATLYAAPEPEEIEELTSPAPGPRQLTRQETRLLDRAERLLLSDCLRARGFRLSSPATSTPRPSFAPTVLDDPRQARAQGYGPLARREEKPAGERAGDAPTALPEGLRHVPAERRAAALTAYHGEGPARLVTLTPDGRVLRRNDNGCRAHAERVLYGSLRLWFHAVSTVDALPRLAAARVRQDTRYAEAVRPWARCMADAGHAYRTPEEVRRRLRETQRPLSRRAEVRLAVAEATCARDTGLAGTARALHREYRALLRERYRDEVTTVRGLRLFALPRARAVLADAPATTADEGRRTRSAATGERP